MKQAREGAMRTGAWRGAPGNRTGGHPYGHREWGIPQGDFLTVVGNGKSEKLARAGLSHSPFPIPCSRARATRAQGFTLLEVLASLALLGLLMLGVYAGVRIATRSVHAGNARIERLDQVRSAQQLLRRELAQALSQTIDHDSHGAPLVFQGTAHGLRYVAPLPGYLGYLPFALVVYQWKELWLSEPEFLRGRPAEAGLRAGLAEPAPRAPG